MRTIKIKNESSREIPSDLLLLVNDKNCTYADINAILDSFNLRVKEYDRVLSKDGQTIDEIFMIGDKRN